MIAAAAGVYTGALFLEGIIRIVIKSCIIAVIGGIVFGIGYLSMRHKQEQNKICSKQKHKGEENGIFILKDIGEACC